MASASMLWEAWELAGSWCTGVIPCGTTVTSHKEATKGYLEALISQLCSLAHQHRIHGIESQDSMAALSYGRRWRGDMGEGKGGEGCAH